MSAQSRLAPVASPRGASANGAAPKSTTRTQPNDNRGAAAMPAAASLDELLLTRIACSGGATRAQLTRDVGPMFSNRLSPGEWRAALDEALVRLEPSVHTHRGRMRVNDTGAATVAKFLGEKDAPARAWSEQRDIWLIAKVLGVDAKKPTMRKALTRADGLQALIVQQGFGLAMRQALSTSKLRSALALVALGQAFGDNVRSGLKSKKGSLSAKAGRVLAGQLLQYPRELSTDGRLIAALAAEQAGAARPETEMLRLALLRNLAGTAAREEGTGQPGTSANNGAAQPSRRTAPIEISADTPQRPGLAQFSAGVLNAARGHAEGWPGNRKAFISRVWSAIRNAHPEWGLSEIEFKDMLAGAHKAGQLVLAGADLKNKQNIKDLEESAILYKNTVWHFVRVED